MSKDVKEGGEKAGKSKKGLIIGVAVAVVVLVAGGVAGVLLIPKLTGEPATAEASEHGGGHDEEKKSKPKGEPEKVVSSKFDPIVVDLRDEDGSIHHLKVGLAAELPESVPEEEFKLLQPRGREAAIMYLRTLTLAQATDPKRYPKLKKELTKRVLKGMEREEVERLLIIDFVAQ